MKATRTIELILKGIEGNVKEFKRLCEAKVCSTDFLADLSKALTQGSLLSTDIDWVMTHLLNVKNQLEWDEFAPVQVVPYEVLVAALVDATSDSPVDLDSMTPLGIERCEEITEIRRKVLDNVK